MKCILYVCRFFFGYCYCYSVHHSGSIATEYSDVGRHAAEDRCCREHDLCPYILSPGECKRGLCNQQQFTRSHCDCDAKFRRCLQGLNTGNLILFTRHTLHIKSMYEKQTIFAVLKNKK